MCIVRIGCFSLVLLAVWACPALTAGEIFSIRALRFHMERYCWGNEFYLSFQGQAQALLARANLTVSIYYAGRLVRSKQIFLPAPNTPGNPISFQVCWGPLNEPYECVLSGPYRVKIALIYGNQNPSERERLASLFKTKLSPYEKSVYWGSHFRQEDRYLKQYYFATLKRLQAYCRELQQEVREALAVPQAIKAQRPNRYLDNQTGLFAKQRWRQWFSGHFEAQVERERQGFLKFSRKLFAARYPKVLGGIDDYMSVLLRLGRLSAMKIHTVNHIKMDLQDTRRIDPLGIRKLEAHYVHLNSLLLNCCRELGVKPEKLFGHRLGEGN